MKSIIHRQQAHLEMLIQEVTFLKIAVDQKHADYLLLSQGMDDFMSQYMQYVEVLTQQRQELERAIQRCRTQIRGPKAVGKPRPEPATDDFHKDNPSISFEENSSIQEEIQSALPDTVDKDKERVFKYFARFWHPDICPDDDNQLMVNLKATLDESEDVIDMLISIPWDRVWVELHKREAWHDQLARLTDWKFFLEEGLERVEQRLAALQQDLRYARYQEWDTAGRSADHFAALAEQERQEIHRLEQTLVTLQAELAKMQAMPSTDGAINE